MEQQLPAHLKRWNWGAFLLNWLWGVGNNTFSAFKVFIPFYGLYYLFKLGVHGNEYAWENGTWRDEAHFVRIQRNWSRAGFIYVGCCLLLAFPIILFVGGVFKNSEPYQMTMLSLEGSQQFIEEVGVPYKTGFITGEMEYSEQRGNSDMSFSVKGAKGTAEVHAVAVKDMGSWTLKCVETRYGTNGTIELLGECKIAASKTIEPTP